MKCIDAVLVELGKVMIAGATPHAPRTRAPIYEPRCVSWAELREYLDRQKAFRRTFGMCEGRFAKLPHLLPPSLQKDESYDHIKLYR